MGVKPLKRNIYCILQDEEPLQSGHEIKSYLALSQQHEFPLSLQLAHCKLCRQGVPNKQATRANITCSTLFSSFIFSPQLDLKLYLWEHLIVMMHSLSFQSPLDTLSASSGPDNWDIPHTAAGSSTSNRVSKQSQCAHKQTETLRGAGTDLNRKTQKGGKAAAFGPHADDRRSDLKKSVLEDQTSKTASTQTSGTIWDGTLDGA